MFIGPGELCVAEEPVNFVIVLGSCVAVTFHCRRLGISIACHCLLPSGPAGNLRYVDSSVNWMIKRFRALGIGRQETQVLIFGGGYMFGPLRTGNGRRPGGLKHIGRENSIMAKKILKKEGYRVAGGEIGGRTGRKIFYDTATGRAMVKRTGSFGITARHREDQRLTEAKRSATLRVTQ